jgi:rubrerythrin
MSGGKRGRGMSDLIRREDAIKALYKYSFVSKDIIEREINAIPSADRPRGEWIFRREFVEDTPFTGYRCSNCNYWQSMGSWNFCPNCGAKMRERKESE